mgnify:CR=1 FL=1|jgi:hypothetical protein
MESSKEFDLNFVENLYNDSETNFFFRNKIMNKIDNKISLYDHENINISYIVAPVYCLVFTLGTLSLIYQIFTLI